MAASASSSRLVPRLALGVVLLAALACGKKGAAPASETSVQTIEAAPDDIVPEGTTVGGADSTPGAPATPATPSAGPTPASQPSAKGSMIIGYDSAFGPMYELDSAGRAIPIKKRKP